MKNTSNQRTSKERGEGGKAIPTDHSIGSETMAIIEESEKNCTTNISFLSADAVRWINKRQHASNGVVGARVMPARALQLREIFQGLDFDNSGSIDISELKEAIEYVAKSSAAGDTPMLKDPEKLSKCSLCPLPPVPCLPCLRAGGALGLPSVPLTLLQFCLWSCQCVVCWTRN